MPFIHDPVADPAASSASRLLSLVHRLLARLPHPPRIERATLAPDRARGIPGGYARLVARRHGETLLILAVDPAADPRRIDGAVAAGLLWLAAYNSPRPPETCARRLWYLLPAARSQTAIDRLSLLSADHLRARIECFEFDPRAEDLRAVEAALPSRSAGLHPRRLRWPFAPRRDDSAGFIDLWRARILALAPDLIEARPLHDRRGLRFAVHGLDFARVECSRGDRPPRASFGVVGSEAEWLLDEGTFDGLERRVRDLIFYRRAEPPDRRHPFYRLRPEAWLESMLRRDIGAVDPQLDARFVYSQTPAWRGDTRAVLDLLAIDRAGRLVIIEIKAGESIELPLQGLDYWMLVDEARRRGEFARRGLFSGVELAQTAPRLYLVTPRLRVHRSFSVLAGAISPQVEVWRLGLNSDWRAGVRVRERTRNTRK